MSRVIIASAAAFETDDIIRSLNQVPYEITRIVTGVGLTQSAIVAANTRELVEGRHVIFCCTAGTIGPFNDVGVFCAKSLELAPWDVRHQKTELLDQFDGPINLNPIEFKFPKCRVVCGLGISVAKEASMPPSIDVLTETIEAYSVARAWIERAKSFTVLVATTNATGPNARAQWKRNFESAAKLTAASLHKELPTLKL
jgi:hypothetical protein